MQPLLAALAGTRDPDRRAGGFDRFLGELPAGVQLFSLLRAQPGSAALFADIMGTAPRLSASSRRRRLLDAVLDSGVLRRAADGRAFDRLIAAEVGECRATRRMCSIASAMVGSEQQFLIGVRVLSGCALGKAGGWRLRAAGRAADRCAEGDGRARVRREPRRVPGGGAAVLAMGKLGGREMTASFRPRPHHHLRFRRRRPRSRMARARWRRPVLCAPDATADQRADGADRGGHAV